MASSRVLAAPLCYFVPCSGHALFREKEIPKADLSVDRVLDDDEAVLLRFEIYRKKVETLGVYGPQFCVSNEGRPVKTPTTDRAFTSEKICNII